MKKISTRHSVRRHHRWYELPSSMSYLFCPFQRQFNKNAIKWFFACVLWFCCCWNDWIEHSLESSQCMTERLKLVSFVSTLRDWIIFWIFRNFSFQSFCADIRCIYSINSLFDRLNFVDCHCTWCCATVNNCFHVAFIFFIIVLKKIENCVGFTNIIRWMPKLLSGSYKTYEWN